MRSPHLSDRSGPIVRILSWVSIVYLIDELALE